MEGNSAHCSEILSGLVLGGEFYSGFFFLFCSFVVEGRGEMLGNYWGGGLRSCILVRELGGGGGGGFVGRYDDVLDGGIKIFLIGSP